MLIRQADTQGIAEYELLVYVSSPRTRFLIAHLAAAAEISGNIEVIRAKRPFFLQLGEHRFVSQSRSLFLFARAHYGEASGNHGQAHGLHTITYCCTKDDVGAIGNCLTNEGRRFCDFLQCEIVPNRSHR